MNKTLTIWITTLCGTLLSGMAQADPAGKSCTPYTTATGYGYETLDAGNLNVVHSALLDSVNQRIPEVSNVYIIKGNFDPTNGKTVVWLYGSGYGNADEDLSVYLDLRGDTGWTALRSALDDATDVNCVIENQLGLDSSTVNLRYITPHKHIDHLNSEFLSALFNTGTTGYGYPLNNARFYIHQADYYDGSILSCTAPCCGETRCTQKSDYFGAAYSPAWPANLKRRFSVLASIENLPCDVVGSFNTPRGLWSIVLSPGHTDGAVSLSHSNYYLHSSPPHTQTTACPIPAGAVQYEVHGYGALR